MDYYCDACDKTIKIKSENKHIQGITHNEFDKYIRIKHTIENPVFFDINKISPVTIKNLIYICLKMILNVFDNEFHPHIQSEFQYNNTIFHLERFI